MRKYCIIILIFLLVCTGCQKTPEEPIVVGKDQQQMIAAALRTGDLKVRIVPVIIPNVMKNHFYTPFSKDLHNVSYNMHYILFRFICQSIIMKLQGLRSACVCEAVLPDCVQAAMCPDTAHPRSRTVRRTGTVERGPSASSFYVPHEKMGGKNT